MRRYAPTCFDGQSVPFKTKADRLALVGKRVGYDSSWSCMSWIGRVTGVGSRGRIEIDGNEIAISSITQVVVLNDQASGGKWRKEE